jgi:hypothetical protein
MISSMAGSHRARHVPWRENYLRGVSTAIVMVRFDMHELGGDVFLIVPHFDIATFATFSTTRWMC